MMAQHLRSTASWIPLLIAIGDHASVRPVHGYSMQPTLNSDQGCGRFPECGRRSFARDFIAVERISMKLRSFKLERGELVLVRNPTRPDRVMVKRVIALDGDVVRGIGDSSVHSIPQGHCWVEGDNPRRSTDSNSFGPIPEGLIEGRVVGVVWPLSRFHKTKTELPQGVRDRLVHISRRYG